MFVRSKMSKPVVFRKNGKSWTIKPNSVTLIDDPMVTAKELKGCYGSRIQIISDEREESPKEGRKLKFQPGPHKYTVLESSKEAVRNAIKNKKVMRSLDEILAEVKDELDKDDKKEEVVKAEDNNEELEKVDDTKEPEKVDEGEETKEESEEGTEEESEEGTEEESEEPKEEKPKKTRRTSGTKGRAKKN